MVTNTLSELNQLPVLQEIHHGTIRGHHAKSGYDYPTIQLPFSFSGLIGLSTHVYQTIHNGAMAFLVVILGSEKPLYAHKDRRIDMAEVAGSNPAEPIVLFAIGRTRAVN
jgi:hypothetical protein